MKGYNGLYLMGNFPDTKTFVEAALLGLRYFDFLEVGIPFSDPVADGPVIEQAGQEVLSRGYCLKGILESVSRIRKNASSDKKIYLMTYANQVFSRGTGNFAKMACGAGADGIVLPDVPFVESAPFRDEFARHGMAYVHFITPESTPAQIEKISMNASGFLYCISIRGITGSELNLGAETKRKIALAKKISPVPVVLGFGIRDARFAALALENAGGFIIGSRAIEILKRDGISGFQQFLQELGQSLSD